MFSPLTVIRRVSRPVCGRKGLPHEPCETRGGSAVPTRGCPCPAPGHALSFPPRGPTVCWPREFCRAACAPLDQRPHRSHPGN